MFQNQQNQVFAQTTHCPMCGRCFCGTTKMQASDGRAVCINCKPAYEDRIKNQPPPPNPQLPR